MKTIPSISTEAMTLAALLREKLKNVGDQLTYEDLTRAIGRDVRTTARGALNTARNVLLREGIVVQCVRTVGVKRANTEEVIDDAESSLIGVRRKVRKSIRKLGTQDYTALNDQQRVRHCVAASQAQAIHILTLKKARERLLGAVQQTRMTLPYAKTLALFEGNGIKEERE